jgi:NAD(P)-dependent dehydrogenase (short-subunit alcohol dehydrogenase family)
MEQLRGKVAIITGAASGMGRATSILFAREGANVVLADLNVAGGEEAAKIRFGGGATGPGPPPRRSASAATCRFRGPLI